MYLQHILKNLQINVANKLKYNNYNNKMNVS